MTINSRMWGIGWREPVREKRRVRRKLIWDTGLPSIPGRTARLKAIYLLQIAAEVEHALMAQYLYSAYSLDEAFDQSNSGQATRIVDRWKRDIRLIARQEMGHFVTVQNLLISIGAEIYVNRENNFSDHPDAYPFPVRFERFNRRSLARYVAIERPAEEEIKDKKTRRLLKEVLQQATEKEKTKVNRVGILYAALYWLFLKDDNFPGPWKIPPSVKQCMLSSGLRGVHVKDTDFAQPDEYEEFAAKRDEWGVFEESMHVDDADPRSRALKAIHRIMLQGEGLSGSGCENNDSHFCRFLRMYTDLKKDKTLLGASRLVPLNPIVPDSHRNEPVQEHAEYITHPESKLWAHLFNIRYQILLLDMLLALSTSRRLDPGLRKTLTEWAGVNEMEHLKQIGQLLPTLPRLPGADQLRAGAPFEIVQFPADNTKRWDQQRVLMQGSDELVRKLRAKVAPHDQRTGLLETIASFDSEKERVDLIGKRSSVPEDYVWKNGGNQRV
jgi:hypothetical protein